MTTTKIFFTQYVLKLLARYPRTVAEIRTKLATKHCPAEISQVVIQEMIAQGYLDDQEYAQKWLDNQLTHRPCGRWFCYQKLRTKGIAAELAKETLAVHYPEDKELKIARRLAERKKTEINKPSKERETKIAFYLKNKGFADDIIYKIVSDL